jgi:hypothetical protein
VGSASDCDFSYRVIYFGELKMKDIQKRELIRSVELIKALGCTYKIITPEGESFGELQVIEKNKKRPPRKHAYGSLKMCVEKYLDLNASVGSVQEIFCDGLDVGAVKHTLVKILGKEWGAKTYIWSVQEDRIELMRTAGVS